VVQREKANLVVVGHRGLSNFAGLLFGSVSGRVAQLAPCTCISVR
jgi:nucleotide-binding universal stress UspA family protein